MAIKKSKFLQFLIIPVLLVSSCSSIGVDESKVNDPDSTPDMQQAELPAATDSSEPSAEAEENLPDFPFEPAPITTESAQRLSRYGSIYPFFPPYVHISADGSRAAAGWQEAVRVYDLNIGKEILQLALRLPECRFGPDRYVRLNDDGSYLAVVTSSAVEVWQVRGKQLYTWPFAEGGSTDNLTCGLDIPQVALSPDGQLLAVSGSSRIDGEFTQYFWIVDLSDGNVIYRWGGSQEMAHGALYGPAEMGFSADGLVLETFNARRFIIGTDEMHTAFRFWSTNDFSELPAVSLEKNGFFNTGKLIFSVSADDIVRVMSKLDGRVIAELAVEGCTFDQPCQTAFSPDGRYALVLPNHDRVQFKRDSIAGTGLIFDLDQELLVEDVQLFSRNADSLRVWNDGSVSQLRSNDLLENTWWTYPAYFSGFFGDSEGRTVFVPQVHDAFNQERTFSGTCRLTEHDLQVECQGDILLSNNQRIRVDPAGGGFKVYTLYEGGEDLLAEIRNPESAPEVVWRPRVLDHAAAENVLFLCLDRDGRDETCFTLDTESNTILQEGLDFFKFNYSPAIQRAVFIDRERKSLVIYDPAVKNSKAVSSYRALAYPVEPVFLPGTQDLLYIVQSVETKKLFIEQVSAVSQKVIKRYDIPELENTAVSALAVGPDGRIWAAGDADGAIQLFDGFSGDFLHALDASDEPLISLAFSSDGYFLSAMDRSGIITVWSVKK